MSLVLEDGSGVSNANAFVSVADADARQSDFGNDNWSTLTAQEKEEAITRATTYMEQAYRLRWQGAPRYPRSDTSGAQTQMLSWPRWGVWSDGYPVRVDVVPQEVKNACADLAFKAAAGDLNADLTRGVVREQVGTLSTEYDPYSPQSVRYPAIDQMLAPLLKANGSTRLVRA